MGDSEGKNRWCFFRNVLSESRKRKLDIESKNKKEKFVEDQSPFFLDIRSVSHHSQNIETDSLLPIVEILLDMLFSSSLIDHEFLLSFRFC